MDQQIEPLGSVDFIRAVLLDGEENALVCKKEDLLVVPDTLIEAHVPVAEWVVECVHKHLNQAEITEESLPSGIEHCALA
jgi:hypothetical protein